MHQLVTSRLLLRPFTPADVEIVHPIYSDPEVMRYVATGPLADITHTQRLVEDYSDHQYLHGYSFWAVIEQSSGALIGDAGLYRTPAGEVELGYTLGKAWWGRGYATEGARAALEYARGVLARDRVISLIHPDNAASARVASRLGATAEGSTELFGRPAVVYAYAHAGGG